MTFECTGKGSLSLRATRAPKLDPPTPPAVPTISMILPSSGISDSAAGSIIPPRGRVARPPPGMNPDQDAGPAAGAVQALSQRPLHYCAMTAAFAREFLKPCHDFGGAAPEASGLADMGRLATSNG